MKPNIGSPDKLNEDMEKLKQISSDDYLRIKEIEKTTRHDIKAVEYFIKEKLADMGYDPTVKECVHFLCTSEDINNLSYSLMLKDFNNRIYVEQTRTLILQLKTIALKYKDLPMLSRTHGQPATPTTLGKELANFTYRLWTIHLKLKNQNFNGKMNGAVGNYNAHYIINESVDWLNHSRKFIENDLGLNFNYYTTQIEPHDSLVEYFSLVAQFNTIAIGMSQDLWHYISLDYFKQKVNKGEVGSSIMPHKINPIDFENAEGNLGIANSLFDFFNRKLPISRFQRDLSDSTVLRNIGVGMGHSILAYRSILKGLDRLEVNADVITGSLDYHWEVLAEPIQQLLRYKGHENAYEELKEFTRGKLITKSDLQKFINGLDIDDDSKNKLVNLSPDRYIGIASVLVDKLNDFIQE